MPSKKNSRKRNGPRQGLSGNPQRRAEQLRWRETRGDIAAAEIAYSLAGGAKPAPWWPRSYERILAAARARPWPSRLADVETQACELVGGEFFGRLRSLEGGLHPAQWLVGLTEATGAALQTIIQNEEDGDWEPLWALLCGLALTAPQPCPVEDEDENVRRARDMFPDIRDPYEFAQAEVARAARLLAERGLAAGAVTADAGPVPAGEPVIARDVYGGRILVAAPFGYGADEPDHWYAWDVDMCSTDVVVAAGVYGSAQDALPQWREAVGAAASGAEFAPCPADVTPALLDTCLQTGLFSDTLDGAEPRELIREFYRMRRRARALAWPAGAAGGFAYNAGGAYRAFADWYAARHADVPADFSKIVSTILFSWGPPDHADERVFYACSPHRLKMTARLIRNGYLRDYIDEALLLLPEWTQWCVSQSGLDGDFAARALEAAEAAAALAGAGAGAGRDPAGEAPFRRVE